MFKKRIFPLYNTQLIQVKELIGISRLKFRKNCIVKELKMNYAYIQLIESCKLLKSNKTNQRKVNSINLNCIFNLKKKILQEQITKITEFLSEHTVLINIDKYTYKSKNKDEEECINSEINWNTLFIVQQLPIL